MKNRKTKRSSTGARLLTTTLSNQEIVNATNGLQILLKAKMPTVAGFRLSQNLNILREHASAYDDYRMQIIDEYAEKDDDDMPLSVGQQFIFGTPAKEKEATDKINELLDTEIEVQYCKIRLSAIDKVEAEGYSLAPLFFMIVDDIGDPTDLMEDEEQEAGWEEVETIKDV